MNNRMRTEQPGVIAIDGKIVGRVIAGVFIKRVDGSKHFLHNPPAISFNRTSLDAATKAGAVYVHITDTSTGKQYCARIDRIERDGFTVERGYGKQIALRLELFASSLDAVRAQQMKML